MVGLGMFSNDELQKLTFKSEYELLGLLGSGGMSTVYLARQTSIDREVALKMLRPEYDRQKFLSEAIIIGELDHPNILRIYEFGETDAGVPF